MKSKRFQSGLYMLLCCMVAIIYFGGCKKDNSGAAPQITRVRTVAKDTVINNVIQRITLDSSIAITTTRSIKQDSTVISGGLNGLYAILGQHLATTTAVNFNGQSAYFNPALVTDNSIIVSIPLDAPWGAGVSNTLTVVTKYGSVSVPFTILQPAPVITSFTPLYASAGDIITITGTTFNGVSAVKIGATAAEIVGTPTPTQIQIKVPSGDVQGFLTVTTPGGTATSPMAYGFKLVVYDDVLANGWWVGGWGGGDHPIFDNTSPVLRGNHSVAVTYTGGYAGFQIGNGGASISLTGMTAIKISIYGGPGTTGNILRISIVGPDKNGHMVSNTNTPPDGVNVSITEGKWQTFTIPLSQFGTGPVEVQQIIVQELSGVSPETIYIDDIGFI
ncbi:IPT/TIG domain-containing protein [Mucilaginibacter pineti]|uniref:IPT/TIG domain-containing protein n=1 Tax=Mucilaginibacter pineti TaxID=1391627 RepID=A0A1G7E5X6_9SPHI|nr:IPT/TIG domain-containing protein [Mucilaginibacter pineti]SDE58880.1 IPT/TIG domain-containing protein [Mucilaginibacter pineti]